MINSKFKPLIKIEKTLSTLDTSMGTGGLSAKTPSFTFARKPVPSIQFIITIKTSTSSPFGLEFMEGILRSVVKVLDGYKKAYSCTLEKIDE